MISFKAYDSFKELLRTIHLAHELDILSDDTFDAIEI
jgi:hypothetical protein